MATPADTMATDISTSKPIAAVSCVAMTKVSGAMAVIMATVEATATIVVFRFPGNEPQLDFQVCCSALEENEGRCCRQVSGASPFSADAPIMLRP